MAPHRKYLLAALFLHMAPLTIACTDEQVASPGGARFQILDGSAMTDAGALSPAADTAASRPDARGPGTRHVEIKGGKLLIDGKPTFLYGGELHYFRTRDKGFDAAKTHALWARALDAMKQAGMNLVTTYAPWDYHQRSATWWDFTGARDVGKFIDMACQRGLYVIYKPGPLITAEWPRGFGTFGAVPTWWKKAHPETLVRKANGDYFTYSFSLTPDPSQRQPTYLHPTFLADVKTWYARAMAPVRRHLGKCLIGVQLDNETNMYWGDRFGDVDYSATALAHYRAWLKSRYKTVAALNSTYGAQYASFAAVQPPNKAPSSSVKERPKNPWYADWYWAGQAYSRDYLQRLRKMIEDLGFKEPDVMITTNDGPFALLFENFKMRNGLMHDGPTKNPIGITGLDLYPKQMPTNKNLQDQPFQSDYFTRLYDHYNDLATGAQGYVYGAELQGGFFSFPMLGRPTVRVEATSQLMARTVGRGLKGGAFYILAEGYNLDSSKYEYQAALSGDGTRRPRYKTMATWGKMLAREGAELLGATEVTNKVVVLVNGNYQVPQAGVLDDMQRFFAVEYPALFGWLAAASINPEVRDTRLITLADLKRFKVAFYANPDFVDDRTATLLRDYADAGGVLVTTLWPGQVNSRFVSSPATRRLCALYPAKPKGYWQWKNTARAGEVNFKLPGEGADRATSFWYTTFWEAAGAAVEPFARERRAFTGKDGALVGYVARDGGKVRAFLGTSVYSRFNMNDYYTWKPQEVQRAIHLARYLVSLGGEAPIVQTDVARHLAWARRSKARTYLFVINDNSTYDSVHLSFNDMAALGLQASSAATYLVRDALKNTVVGQYTGAALKGSGLTITLPPWTPAVLTVTPR